MVQGGERGVGCAKQGASDGVSAVVSVSFLPPKRTVKLNLEESMDL